MLTPIVLLKLGMVVCTAVKDLDRLREIHKELVPYLKRYEKGAEYRALDASHRRTRPAGSAPAPVQRHAAVAKVGSSIKFDTHVRSTGYNTANKRKRQQQQQEEGSGAAPQRPRVPHPAGRGDATVDGGGAAERRSR